MQFVFMCSIILHFVVFPMKFVCGKLVFFKQFHLKYSGNLKLKSEVDVLIVIVIFETYFIKKTSNTN